MSTAATSPDLSKAPVDTYVPRSTLSALVATVTALAATVLAVLDLFANGLGPTVIHTVVALGVFGVVRLCVGLALNPSNLLDDPDDAPESTP